MGLGEFYARFVEENDRRINTTIGRLTFGMISGTSAGLCCGLIAGGITFVGAAAISSVTDSKSILFILTTLMIYLAIGTLAGMGLGIFGGIIGAVIGLVVSIGVNKSVIDRAIRGGAIGGTIVAIGGICFLISFLTYLD